MRYTVQLRMKNPGAAKYLIDSREVDNMVGAFELATLVLSKVDESEHFVRIIDNQTGDTIANFNDRKAV